jgi:LuxR family maltose regulon positive regulatory protein
LKKTSNQRWIFSVGSGSGEKHYVMGYLFNEVFSRPPPEISQYLLGTAILDRFCGPLCESVCTPRVLIR